MTDHLPPDVLARLADQDWSELSPAQRRHLAACAACRDALVEATGTSVAFREAPSGPAVPSDLTSRIVAATSGRRQVRRRRWATAATVLPAAAVLLVMVLAGRPDDSAPDHLIDPVRLALGGATEADLVFPGLSGESSGNATFRGRGDDEALRAAVRDLGVAYRDHPDRPELAQWLVGGYLALDDLPSARVFVDDALRRHRGHGALLAAAGVVAYRQGNDARADSLLTAAIAAGQDGPDVQFNLAVVHLSLGRPHEAVTILRRLADDPAQPLASQAARMLDRIGAAG